MGPRGSYSPARWGGGALRLAAVLVVCAPGFVVASGVGVWASARTVASRTIALITRAGARVRVIEGDGDAWTEPGTWVGSTFDLLIMPRQPHGPQGAAGRYYREDVRRFMATHLLRAAASGTIGRPVPE
jgi:hypothetical protein